MKNLKSKSSGLEKRIMRKIRHPPSFSFQIRTHKKQFLQPQYTFAFPLQKNLIYYVQSNPLIDLTPKSDPLIVSKLQAHINRQQKMKKTTMRPHATFYPGQIAGENESAIKYRSADNKAKEMEEKLRKMYAASKPIKIKKLTPSNYKRLYFSQEDKTFLS